jgi:SAM-dependent methyltransferase
MDDFNETDYISHKWDNPSHWDKIYEKDQHETMNIHRNPRYILNTLQKLGRPPPLNILDAGTGISVLPEFLAYLGHHVVAIDISPKAIGIGKTRKVTEQDLMLCFGEMFSQRYRSGKKEYLDQLIRNPVDIRLELNKLFHPWGEVMAREVWNWNDPALHKKFGEFDIILNQNGLRSASMDLIRLSFQSFFKLLKPGGILIETNINALIRVDTIEKYAKEAGFHLLNETEVAYNTSNGEKLQMNEDEKYAVCCWPTG